VKIIKKICKRVLKVLILKIKIHKDPIPQDNLRILNNDGIILVTSAC